MEYSRNIFFSEKEVFLVFFAISKKKNKTIIPEKNLQKKNIENISGIILKYGKSYTEINTKILLKYSRYEKKIFGILVVFCGNIPGIFYFKKTSTKYCQDTNFILEIFFGVLVLC